MHSRVHNPKPPVRVLVTGFGPFPGVAFNASASLIEALAAMPALPGIRLFAEIIPVIWDAAIECSQRAIAKYRPHAILHFGVAKRATMFEVETRAVNMSGPKEDREGRVRGERALIPSAPFTQSATLPAQKLLQALRQAGYPAILSKDAGRYLCNALLYTSLNKAAGSKNYAASFIHIPSFGIETDVCPRLTMKQAAEGARVMVRASAEAIRASVSRANADNSGEHDDGSQRLHGNGRGRVVWHDRSS